MFLSKHSNGRYYIYYEVNGKRRCKSTGCYYKKNALKFLVDFKVELEEKKAQIVIPISLKEFQFHFFRLEQ